MCLHDDYGAAGGGGAFRHSPPSLADLEALVNPDLPGLAAGTRPDFRRCPGTKNALGGGAFCPLKPTPGRTESFLSSSEKGQK